MLLPLGSESHSFEPSTQDIVAIQNCDIFICIGGESEKWVDKVMDSLDTEKVKVIDKPVSVTGMSSDVADTIAECEFLCYNLGNVDLKHLRFEMQNLVQRDERRERVK